MPVMIGTLNDQLLYLPVLSLNSFSFVSKYLLLFLFFKSFEISQRRRSRRSGGTNSKGSVYRSLLRNSSTEKQSQSHKGKEYSHFLLCFKRRPRLLLSLRFSFEIMQNSAEPSVTRVNRLCVYGRVCVYS